MTTKSQLIAKVLTTQGTGEKTVTKIDLVRAIGHVLTELDAALQEPELINQPAKWQQVYALRKHLDDQQRRLVAQMLDEDDAEYRALTGMIQVATAQLENAIEDLRKVNKVIDTVAQIAADLDQVIKLV